MRRRLLTTVFLCGLVVASQAQAPIAVTLDPATTSLHWTLNTTLHTVHGTFKLKSGSVRIDPQASTASGLIVIDATSGESGDAARDKTMHRDVLQKHRFPEIAFRPTRITPTTGKIDLATPCAVTVDGILTLHGQDHLMQLTVDLRPQGSAIALSTHFKVPFVAWGLKDPSTFVFRVDKEVLIDIDSVASPAK